MTAAALEARAELVGDRLAARPQDRFLEYRRSLEPAHEAARRSGRLASVQPADFLANEVMRQVHEGHVSRAAALLSSPGMAPASSESANKLRDLWSTPTFA